MTKYIDAEPLEAEQYKGFNRVSETDWQKGYWSGIDEMCDKIKEQPTADVVEVVRCKDCACFDRQRFSGDKGYCKRFRGGRNEMNYCDFGYREEVE